MLIKSISLKNFRQYKGHQDIEFSIDKKKNVTVITGENTCGKTTLVQSFIWCLYGQADFKDKDILNAEVKDALERGKLNGRESASVRIRLLHDDIEYIIERIQNYEFNNKFITHQILKMYECDSKGKTTPIDDSDIDTIINDILPENLSDYFFFWGERIEKLSEKGNISEAVKQFLGLDTMDSAIKHLSMACSKIIKDMPTSGDSDIEVTKEKIAVLERDNNRIDIEIKEADKNYKYYKEQADGLYKELMTSENKVLALKQEEYQDKVELLEQKKTELDRYKKKFFQDFNDSKNYVYFLSNDLEKNAVKLLKENPEPTVGWKYIDLNAINEILKRGKCICGNEACDGSKEREYLLEQRKLVAPNVTGGVINSFIEEAERRENYNSNFYNLLHDDYRKINEIKDEMLELEYKIEQLKNLIFNKSDMKLKKAQYDDKLNKANEYMLSLGAKQEAKKNNNANIEIYNQNIQKLLQKNSKLQKHRHIHEVAKSTLSRFQKEYKANEDLLRSKLEEYVCKNFDRVYSGERKIVINDNYIANTLNKVGDTWISSETSPGLETVKNFAFISGLVQCAKEKIIGVDENEIANKNTYPLVLDAPFSQADEKHVPAISGLISDVAEQTILVVMEKDWNYAKTALQNKVGKFYKLEKDTETCTTVKEAE